MPSNDTDTPGDPALQRAKAARDAVAAALEGYFERLAAMTQASRTEMDADLRAAGRLMARNTRRQLAANLTLARRLMEARSLPTVLALQRDFLRRQADWALRDSERMGSLARDLMKEGQRAVRPTPVPAGGCDPAPRSDARDSGPPEPGPS